MTAVRWTPGMQDSDAFAICVRARDGQPVLWAVDGEIAHDEGDLAEPDMTHAGTRGEVLEQAREAWGDPYLTASYDHTGWRITGRLDYAGLYRFETEEAAIMAALESAP